MDKTHGVFLGRFQPFHLGHQMIINEIISDGLKPLILIGVSKTTDKKNPFSYIKRASMLLSAFYPGTLSIDPMHDHPCNNEWARSILAKIDTFCGLKNSTLYYHRKEIDCTEHWGGGHYVDLLKDKIDVKESEFAKALNLPICATDIRKDPHSNRHFLHGKVYREFYDK